MFLSAWPGILSRAGAYLAQTKSNKNAGISSSFTLLHEIASNASKSQRIHHTSTEAGEERKVNLILTMNVC